MADIKVHEFTTVDGVVDAPTWTFDYGFPADLAASVSALMASSEGILLGRKTFEVLAPTWNSRADADVLGGVFFNETRKYVVSSTLTRPEDTWPNSTVIGPYSAARLRALKRQMAGDLYLSGSATLVRALVADGLVDELHLFVYPLAVGKGIRLFPEDGARRPLSLLDVRALSNGVTHLTYGRESADPPQHVHAVPLWPGVALAQQRGAPLPAAPASSHTTGEVTTGAAPARPVHRRAAPGATRGSHGRETPPEPVRLGGPTDAGGSMSITDEKSAGTAPQVRSFHIDVPEEDLVELRRRVSATRWPSKELVADRSQGVQSATMQELARHWVEEYDWRRCEQKLNALPQFLTEIDGVDIHFVHVRSPHADALPLIMTHGWPGSVVELLETVGHLTDPTAHGGRAEDAFHVVLPSLPGYGFSGEPTELGWDVGRVARAWAELMRRLGHTRYVAQGGDVGAGVSDAMGRHAPEGLLGIHVNLLVSALGGPQPENTEQERAAAAAVATFKSSGFSYFLQQATRPQTIGYGLLDSPVALAAWMLDHDTDSYYKMASAFVAGTPVGNLTRDHVLDNITLYWLTGTGASAARSYWESYGPDAPAAAAAADTAPQVSVPVGFTTFPGEIWAAPRSWVEQSYPTLSYFNEVDRGGHFAAWEEPELFASEVRAAFGKLRTPIPAPR